MPTHTGVKGQNDLCHTNVYKIYNYAAIKDLALKICVMIVLFHCGGVGPPFIDACDSYPVGKAHKGVNWPQTTWGCSRLVHMYLYEHVVVRESPDDKWISKKSVVMLQHGVCYMSPATNLHLNSGAAFQQNGYTRKMSSCNILIMLCLGSGV